LKVARYFVRRCDYVDAVCSAADAAFVGAARGRREHRAAGDAAFVA
jgi:hypothetical protein